MAKKKEKMIKVLCPIMSGPVSLPQEGIVHAKCEKEKCALWVTNRIDSPHCGLIK